ncbi:Glutamyl-tRNA synthetase [Mycoplasmopsis bovigenitalium 51080]|uniref:Glutamate--tRNA ligase n=1 Tax=Mycoplasmopsis bovigenitalium 51080 TaxID=1188235 RepID=N9TS72_9BACT|nr:glutamate--tRNA ligase [Mycoplasmopsis bovigenitalium]ENY68930.1 Glutamyl-tRNA synthetase [Mycoplasmopsis bovigenitalium 51080]
MTKKVRTRYAPSPTGYLHIGGARTALFCYLYAKHFNGDFVFRLEDTDIKRNVPGGEASQLDNLAWLGIIPDESPLNPNPKYKKYRQSEKLDRYREIANLLIEKGFAYKAYDNAEELEAQHSESEAKGIPSFKYDKNWLKITEEERKRRDDSREFSIRFSMPKNQSLSWNDLVRGNIDFNSSDIGDWVIFKSDGYPTYNFAVVIDDYDMEITHVLRGEEHITNTPKQLAIYNALGWDAPQFGHLTVITNMEGKKLSKRDTSLKQFIEDYKNEGYVPEALFNFLTLLGWTAEDSSEIMSKQEIIEKFDPSRLSKSPSKFDIVKMNWFSKQYFKNISTQNLISKLDIENNEWSTLFVDTFKESCATIDELKHHLNKYLNKDIEPSFDLSSEEKMVVSFFFNLLNSIEFTIENIQLAIEQTKSKLSVTGKKLFMPIRKAATYAEHGPELAKAIYLFGKDCVVKRLKSWN